jgi:hypothetical protein
MLDLREFIDQSSQAKSVDADQYHGSLRHRAQRGAEMVRRLLKAFPGRLRAPQLCPKGLDGMIARPPATCEIAGQASSQVNPSFAHRL